MLTPTKLTFICFISVPYFVAILYLNSQDKRVIVAMRTTSLTHSRQLKREVFKLLMVCSRLRNFSQFELKIKKFFNLVEMGIVEILWRPYHIFRNSRAHLGETQVTHPSYIIMFWLWSVLLQKITGLLQCQCPLMRPRALSIRSHDRTWWPMIFASYT